MRRTAAFDLVNFANRFRSLLPERNNADRQPRVRLVNMRQGHQPLGQQRLGVGFVGSGFNARFHMQAFRGVRDADVRGVWSPNQEHRQAPPHWRAVWTSARRNRIASISDLVADPAIDALWLTGPNHTRVENIEEIVHALESGRGTLRGIACEKPLARTVAEASHIVRLIKRTGIAHGYLENQVFAPQVQTGHALLWARGAATAGRPYLARAAEEHSGPHMPWFWRGELQGGGVLNDMMCHSVLLVRHLLTRPGAALSSVRPVRVTAHIASLKWTRPHYRRELARIFGRGSTTASVPPRISRA